MKDEMEYEMEKQNLSPEGARTSTDIIRHYRDFEQALLTAGFSIGGGNDEGIFTLSSRFGEEVRWFSDDPETDPWAWRLRILTERNDIAYGKFFFHKSGYITKEWLPYFMKLRRDSASFAERYESGVYSAQAKNVYEAVQNFGPLAVYEIRRQCGFTKKDNSKFEKALTELQMGFFLTVTGHTRRVSARGEYGWHVSVLDRPENYYGEDVWEQTMSLSEAEAEEGITRRVLEINPLADTRRIRPFIYGRA